MTDIRFGRLEDLPLREAWKHEASQFTPWLAVNIDHLSDAIGIPLELSGTEVSVERFSADILARNPIDDSVVLIENQFEQTDHTHLGQIMTYLAGLEAQAWRTGLAPRSDRRVAATTSSHCASTGATTSTTGPRSWTGCTCRSKGIVPFSRSA